MPRRGNLFTSSLASGFIFGFLSGLPFIGALNCACCSLIVGAGIFTSYLLVKGSDVPVTFGRAAAGGFLTGVFSIPVFMITWVATTIILGQDIGRDFEEALERAAEMTPEAQQAAEMLREVGVFFLLTVMACVFFVTNTLFGTLGGLIGRAIFEKRTSTAAGPPAGAPSGAPPTPPPPVPRDPGPPPPPPVQPS